MNDNVMTVYELRAAIATFIKEREWNQFHNPKSVSMSIAGEAAELMEKFLWCTNEASFQVAVDKREEVEDEAADVLITLINFANATGIDLSSAVQRKLAKNAQKYPVEKCKGRAVKYNQL